MPDDKEHDDLTIFGKETDNSKKISEPLASLDNTEEIGEREMDQAIQDEEVKAEQQKAAGEKP